LGKGPHSVIVKNLLAWAPSIPPFPKENFRL